MHTPVSNVMRLAKQEAVHFMNRNQQKVFYLTESSILVEKESEVLSVFIFRSRYK